MNQGLHPTRIYNFILFYFLVDYTFHFVMHVLKHFVYSWFYFRRIPAQSTPYVALLAGIACVVALLLPTQAECKEEETNIPTYLHLTVNLKIAFAYVLGLVSFVVLRLQ